MPLCTKHTKTGKPCKNYTLKNFDFCVQHSPECVICIDKLAKKNVQELHCGHMFHHDCIEKWLETSSTCPCCRQLTDHQIMMDPGIKREHMTQEFVASMVLSLMALPPSRPTEIFMTVDERTNRPLFYYS